ncbi:hypothetical protein EVAR_94865_1 [Eumeta japonica]|uniref:Uncharacterized protein n=1 Tax=Eumeta variegata TaxID=151549 RepID=A0A4C1VBT7_EUMVA|nr:hypothetical protein EVAR_94865_1 [Eumeta japonica]
MRSILGGDTEKKLKLRPPGTMAQIKLSTKLVSEKSKQFLSRLHIDDSFLQVNVSSWDNDAAFLEAKRRINRLKVVNDTAERAVKLMTDYNSATIIAKTILVRCIQELGNLYPDCKKTTYAKEKLP